MIKVMIVDDEPKLREGLRSLIPWEDLGYTVAATAANGLQALEKYHTCYPELLVVDIRMPGMDGLELIGELRREGSACHVLILSGHADFEYAKQAIAYKTDGYLLKPVDEDEMIGYLSQLRETIEQEDRFSRWTEEEPARNREAVLRGLLLSPSSEEERIAQVAEAGLEPGIYEVVILEWIEPDKTTDEEARLVRTALGRYLGEAGNAYSFSTPPSFTILLKDPPGSEAGWCNWHAELSAVIGSYGFDFKAAAGGPVTRPEDAAHSYEMASELLRRSFFYPKAVLITPGTSGYLAGDVEKEKPEEGQDAESRLLLAVETGSGLAIRRLVETISGELISAESDELKIKEHFMRILSSVLARLEPAYPEIRAYAAEHSAPIGELYHSHYLSELLEQVISFLEEIAGQMSSGGRGNEIKKITELIHRRYNENLKLETLSELFNYNSAYLGKMFKNITGEYFNTYVDKVRIEKAKQFLTQGMKVYEVAEKVGYMNPDYFNAKFRKYVGTSPTSYRKNS